MNTGDTPVFSQNRLLTTIAYQFNGTPTYALEGSIFIAGAVVQWLRDGLEIIETAADTATMAEASTDTHDVIIVPAFTGLGAPYWNAECRGAIYGLTRSSGRPELCGAALESVGFQTRDLLEAMNADWAASRSGNTLRIDGGMAASNWAMQFLADIIGNPVDRPKVLETTAMGAAWLAGMASGVLPDQDQFARSWARDRRFEPVMSDRQRNTRYEGWKNAVSATLTV